MHEALKKRRKLEEAIRTNVYSYLMGNTLLPEPQAKTAAEILARQTLGEIHFAGLEWRAPNP